MKSFSCGFVSTLIIVSQLFTTCSLCSQTLTQTIKGNVFDSEIQSPLIGASVVIHGTDPLLGTATDLQGNYKIKNVPTGRYNIQVNYLGYDPVIVPEVIVTSGKEVVINIGLKQSVIQINEVTVNAHSRKDKPLNTMASISARSFTVEETQRYAGGIDDPARLVSAFAGVTVGNLQDNAIIIRGNSPKGVSWRLEGVEIPNPNHMPGGNVAGGGFVTVFSSQLLANSDFFTGAFPAEYGNALAGVFDMKLRNGNTDKREHTLQAGMLGIDIASEGPFKKGKKPTYLFNYRYSTFGLLCNLGIVPSDQVPRYQDLSFKLNFPTKSAGTFSLWGIGAIDRITEPVDKDSTKWESDWDRIHFDWDANMYASGLSHKYLLGNKTLVNTTISVSGIRNTLDQTRVNDSLVMQPDAYFVDKSGKIILTSFINHKFNAHLSLKTGIYYNFLFNNLNFDGTLSSNRPETYQNFIKEKGNSSFIEYYAQSRFNLSENLILNAGVHVCYLSINNDYSIEPRLGLNWEFVPKHSISLGYGKHSQMEELKIYFINNDVDGEIHTPNKNLKLSHAQHIVFGYDWLINNKLRLKIEPYYQFLYDIPGIPDSSYSMINFKQDWLFRNTLANNSVGRNIGIDFTFERFLNNNYYYLITASIFNSSYKGDDGKWRNTRYNKNYVINLLFGKEFNIKKKNVLGINGRFNFMGGERTTPVLENQSLQEHMVLYDETKAFKNQDPATYYLDLAVSYRINKKRHSSVWSFQVKNALGSPLYEGEYYNYRTKSIENSKTVVIVPYLSYRIDF
ncbi:MAG: TonB-dependent receptor [Bacteroidales bacterium]|nr:TonB-dependent receptor [Bacteroidales bacterium]